jgi:hypothetical protein
MIKSGLRSNAVREILKTFPVCRLNSIGMMNDEKNEHLLEACQQPRRWDELLRHEL